MRRAGLVLTIDTEEEGLWSARYRANGNTCRNILRLPRLQALLSRLGVKPTWLVDNPVATDATAGRVLRELAGDGRGEIGAHLHPWCTPPLVPSGEDPYYSYPHRLPPWLQEAKLAELCRAIESNLGCRPRSYRAGRWGFDHTTVPLLEKLGIAVDSSVDPLWWDPSPGGPRHVRAPQEPYRLARTDICRPGSSAVTEVPLTRVVTGARGPQVEQLLRVAPPMRGLRWLMRKLGLRSLSPEGQTARELRAIADAVAARGLSVFHVTFHSSVTLPGATPYVRSERDLDDFLARLESVLDRILDRHGAIPLGLSEVPVHLGAKVLSGTAA
jgi:hypothetical protein